ncbi:MAG TPA: hypothetical protein VD931_04545, partial [Baekduia sp.]|nr:hypothetical protein [Baekduia sp.]
VLAAVLRIFEGFAAGTAATERRNDAQQRARGAVDQITRELRSLASPGPDRPLAVDLARPYDLVFRSVDPFGPNSGANTENVRRVRYCLDDGGRLFRQMQTWATAGTPPAPPGGACPDPGPAWTATEGVAAGITNRAGDRPLWAFDAPAEADVSFIRVTVHVNRPGGRAAEERTLATGVFLRNQNRVPAASFTATPTGSRHVLLNGTLSTDPEARPLTYEWYDGGVRVGTGITFDYLAPATGPRTLVLRVSDPGGLRADAAQEVDVR